MKYFFLILFLFASKVYAAPVSYKTNFGQCPSKSAGTLTLKLIKEFEKNGSLKSLKQMFVTENLQDKFFVDSYNISYNPQLKSLKFDFECPFPLAKVSIVKDDDFQTHTAILVDNGRFYDPTYEVLLRSESKLTQELPSLALPMNNIESEAKNNLTEILKGLDAEFRRKISEIILDNDLELTVILSIESKPSSAFLGSDNWTEKVKKLQRIVNHLEKKNQVPSIINLTNSKKVVVKFSDKN